MDADRLAHLMLHIIPLLITVWINISFICEHYGIHKSANLTRISNDWRMPTAEEGMLSGHEQTNL